jgi:sialate O-acetylesterase
VWLCSGQSNMEWALRNSFEPGAAIAASADDGIRLFQVKNTRSDKPLDDVEAAWQPCGPDTVPTFSAVAYYFARELRKTLKVPVGLIQSDWGGTPAEAWTREAVITNDPLLKDIADRYPAARAGYEKALADYPAVVEKAKAEGKPEPRRPNAPWKYGELYNGMIAPLVNYTIRGAIWYQGESNSGRAAQYRYLFPAMIQNWRNDFGLGDFPFLLVQLAPFKNGDSAAIQYAETREAQAHATTMKNVGMAVITDVGEENDIHPRKKEPVGVRLSLLARRIAYGEKVLADGPTVKGAKAAGGKFVLKFGNVGDGLEAKGGDISQREVTAGTLVGFTVAGADGVFVPATATLVGKDTIEVSAPTVPDPKAVRYGFVNFPVANLYNSAGLPASPFRTDAPEMPPLRFPKN